MTTPKPYREWWIDERPDVNWDAAFRKEWGKFKFIHVIEYAALKEAEAELEWLKKCFEDCRALNTEQIKCSLDIFDSKRATEALLDKAVAALEKIAPEAGFIVSGDGAIRICEIIAKQALAEIKKARGGE